MRGNKSIETAEVMADVDLVLSMNGSKVLKVVKHQRANGHLVWLSAHSHDLPIPGPLLPGVLYGIFRTSYRYRPHCGQLLSPTEKFSMLHAQVPRRHLNGGAEFNLYATITPRSPEKKNTFGPDAKEDAAAADDDNDDIMASELSTAPALSTPAEHLFEHVAPEVSPSENEAQSQRRSDHELANIYEIARTAREVRQGGWKRIALQFPDTMLGDAPWVVQALSAALQSLHTEAESETGSAPPKPERIYILADTSYSSCCVDEIAAEHADADVVVHYGRSCLSPTSRLPVIYVFTQHELDHGAALAAFANEFPDKQEKVIVMADVTYQDHVPRIVAALRSQGYANVLSTAIKHDPMGRIPNRTIISSSPDGDDTDADTDLDPKDYSIFHISAPPTALLLALSSRVKSLYILPTTTTTTADATPTLPPAQRLLGRRYARLLSLATAGIIGILVNTLSVANYLSSIDSIRAQIAAKGKKSYTVVVGKLNPAKLANFAEVDGWVVVGCWESSLVEDDSAYYRPVITPFELEMALAGDEKRVWTGEWWGGIEGVKPPVKEEEEEEEDNDKEEKENGDGDGAAETTLDYGDIEDEESEPPEFDLRTGRLVSHSRPMRMAAAAAAAAAAAPKKGSGGAADAAVDGVSSPLSGALALRPKAELAMVNGVVSPGAEFLRSQRTWQGLGSDFSAENDSTAMEEGRSGVARGYTVGENSERR
ncbi:putative diphthamide synthesis protein-domain-containing protein [Bombardia bombarda]|uniref:2-(3-amino-3-carboxypropyl)histidine synthase subunit 2 n=1 Tax=Bombardia bombarda TaxID=252184 RepID=A0AA39X166_9PEZI|nr:putative diphthamide synthesis protein-domain-containing protein [Bombardia bombarda]